MYCNFTDGNDILLAPSLKKMFVEFNMKDCTSSIYNHSENVSYASQCEATMKLH